MKKIFVLIVILVISLFLLTACSEQQINSIQKAFVDNDGYLVVVYSDGTEEIAGYVKGETGKTGKKGQDGKDGVNGVDGRDGIDGKDGLNGIDGKDGKDGRDGVDGKDGKDGEKGEKGDTGAQGPKGDKGDTGEKGEQGIAGTNGKDGVDGKDGHDGVNGKDSIRYVETIKNLPLTFYEDYEFTKIKTGDKLEWFAFSISYSPYLGTWGFPIYRSTLSQFDLAGNGMGDTRRITLNGITRTNAHIVSYGLDANGFHDLSGQQTVYVCGTITKAGYTDTYYGSVRQYWIYIDVKLIVEANYLAAHYNEF